MKDKLECAKRLSGEFGADVSNLHIVVTCNREQYHLDIYNQLYCRLLP